MSGYPTNILQQVQTYQPAALGYLENLLVFAKIFNPKFKEFNSKFSANLGSSVTFDLPFRSITSNGLVVSFDSIEQRAQTLTCDQAVNSSVFVTSQDQIFNLDKDGYMEKIGKSKVEEIASDVDANLALNITGSVPVMTVVNGQSVPTGALHTESGPFRFYDGTAGITSFQQLAQMHTNYRNFGSAKGKLKVVIPDTAEPVIIGNGLNQFAIDRNNELAQSWEIGTFNNAEYYVSNNLPLFTAGSVGNQAQTLTVVSTNDPTGENITQITFSGATASDSGAIVSGDMFKFNDNVSGQPNLRYLTFIGHKVSSQPVQFRATANAAADGSGNVTVNILPALSSAPGKNQNILYNIAEGMQCSVLPNRRCGLVLGGDAAFLAMPRLPNEEPFPTSSEADPDTGISLRMYYGTLFGQNQRGLVHDVTWGSTIVPEYAMQIAFPETI